MARSLQTVPSPAFIHIDMDDLWAVGECYGIPVPPELRHRISGSALPRFRLLFRELNIRATFFVVGRDLESPAYAEQIKGLMEDGHAVANHSASHRLDFRALSAAQIYEEISVCHELAAQHLGVQLRGFRAPGYAASPQLTQVLQQMGYAYDASLMPSPFGFVFRAMDARMQKKVTALRSDILGKAGEGSTGNRKTQYPLFRDALRSLSPAPLPPVSGSSSSLLQLSSATSPLLRLPFQAGVCMRLGWPYFRACFSPYRRAIHLPFVFLFHAADLADFSDVPIPFFRDSSFFGTPVSQRLAMAERFLRAISQTRPITTTEEWLTWQPGAPQSPQQYLSSNYPALL